MRSRDIRKRILLGLAGACLLFSGCGGKSRANVVTVFVSGTSTLLPTQTETLTANVSGATDVSATFDCSFTTTPNPTTATPNPTPSASQECTAANGAVGALSNIQNTSTTVASTATFTAPATFPDQTKFPNVTIIITATSNADKRKNGTFKISLLSGINVSVSPATATVGTGESFQFTAGLTNDTTPNDVTWFVTQDTTVTTTSKHCDPGCGSIDSTGKYTAPATVPTTATVTVVAVSKVDSARAASASVTIVKAAPITFTGISPTVALQGGILQDIYLNATNLRSTVSVLFNNVQVNPSQLKIVNASLARLRLNASNLAAAGTGQISVQFPDPSNPGQTITLGPLSLQINTVRPGLINSVPDSFPPGSLPGPILIDGGFFGPSSSPIVAAQFNGSNEGVTDSSPRQLSVNLTAVPSGGPGAAGLFPVSVINSSASPSLAVSNVAVQPDFAGSNPPCLFNTVNLPVPATSTATSTVPSAIAIDPILEYAAVTEEATNTIQFINVAGLVPPATCPAAPVTSTASSSLQFPVGNLPTSVAIDPFLSPSPGNHLAVVVNSGDKSLTLLQIPSGAVVATVDLSTLLPPASSGSSTPTSPSPYAVGIDPFTHRALVAFASTNAGFIVNLDPAQSPTCLGGSAPYCAIASVGLNTGAHPQIGFDSNLRVAYVTPGGAGRMSVVDLNQLTSSTATTIAAAPAGAKRTLNVVTIATTQAHNIDPGKLGTVFISGVATGANGTDFNGSFSVTSVIDATHFTYAQSAKDDTSGGGSVSTVPNPMITFSISQTIQGIALNSQTHVAALADPNTQFGQITFIKTPDETVYSITLNVGSFLNNSGSGAEIGAAQVGFQPFSNVAVSFNPQRNEVSLLDPVRPQRLALALATGQTGVGSFTPAGSSAPATVNGALAVDPSTNLALVVNSGVNSAAGSMSTISVVQLGQLKPVHIAEWLLQAAVPPTPARLLAPQTAFTSTADLPISIFGSGFTGSPTVRLDGAPVGSPTVVSDRQIDITIPASFLAAPRRFALDVLNGGALSNATDFAVAQSVDLTNLTKTMGCATPQPMGVAVGEDVVIGGTPLDLAVVTNNGSGCNTVSVIDVTPGSMTFGQLTQIVAVGTGPTGVAVIPRLGLAVVANSTASGTSSGAGTASVIDLTKNPPVVTQTVSVNTQPTGVAINPDTAQAYVLNTKSNTMTQIDLTANPPKATGTAAVDEQPIAIAIDPDRKVAVIGAVSVSAGSFFGSGVLDVLDISGTTPARKSSIGASTSLPTGVVFDPVSTNFFAVDSLGNDFVTANPDTGGAQAVRVGVNPTSLAYDYQTGTLITVNTISNTVSFVDVVNPQRPVTKATLPLGAPPQSVGLTNPQFGAAIHLRSNLAVIADLFNNRVLLYPMPH